MEVEQGKKRERYEEKRKESSGVGVRGRKRVEGNGKVKKVEKEE
jgi:hypothetical protein